MPKRKKKPKPVIHTGIEGLQYGKVDRLARVFALYVLVGPSKECPRWVIYSVVTGKEVAEFQPHSTWLKIIGIEGYRIKDWKTAIVHVGKHMKRRLVGTVASPEPQAVVPNEQSRAMAKFEAKMKKMFEDRQHTKPARPRKVADLS